MVQEENHVCEGKVKQSGLLRGNRILTLSVAVELFTRGTALAVSVCLLWKQDDGKE